MLVLVLLWGFLSMIVTDVMSSEKFSSRVEKKTPVVKTKLSENKITQDENKIFQQKIEEGKRLFLEEMDYVRAIFQFKEAETLAETQQQKSDVYFYLSLVYYATIAERGEEECREAIRKLIEVNYFVQLDLSICPSNYLVLFQEIKSEYGVLQVQSRPPEADVYLNDNEESVGKTPLTIGARSGSIDIRIKKGKKEKKDEIKIEAGQTTAPPIYVFKNKLGFLFILGGVALAGGAGIALLAGKKKNEGSTTGSIQVNSTPTGAAVYLNGTETGQTTNTTLLDVTPGNHTIKLVKEGYVDYENAVMVTAGQTASIDAALSGHTITITNPSSSTSWRTGTYVDIYWDTDEVLTSQMKPISFKKLQIPIKNNLNSFSYAHQDSDLSKYGYGAINLKGRKNSTAVPGSIHTIRNFPESHIPIGIFSENDKAIHGKISSISSMDPLIRDSCVVQAFPKRAKSQDSAKISTLSFVDISLYDLAGEVLRLYSNLENQGAITWQIPETLADSTDYRIRVSCKDEPSIFGESETFEIKEVTPKGPLSLFLAASSVDGPYNDLSNYGHRVTHSGNVDLIYDSQLGRNVYSFANEGYLEIQDHDVLDWGLDDSLTIETSIKMTDTSQGQVILDKGNLPADTNYSRNYGFSYSQNNVNFIYGDKTSGIGNPQNYWTVFAARISKAGESTIKIETFVDGVKRWERVENASDLVNKFPLYIGTGYQTDGIMSVQPFSGLMDYIRIYKSILSEGQLNKNPTGPLPDYR